MAQRSIFDVGIRNDPSFSLKHETWQNDHVSVLSTTGVLSSHILMENFEEQYHMHLPEMTFFQNSLTVCHSLPNPQNDLTTAPTFVLHFSTAEALLATIFPTPLPVETSTSNSDVTRQSNEPPISLELLFGDHPRDVFTPSVVTVANSKEWQAYHNSHRQIAEVDEANDWTFTSLYQGQSLIVTPNDVQNTTQQQQHNIVASTASSASVLNLIYSHLVSLTPPAPSSDPRVLLQVATAISSLSPRLPTQLVQRPLTWSRSPLPIDYALLSDFTQAVRFYATQVLFEDELHDNGISRCSLRIRIMDTCYFILFRVFVRVDGVLVRVRDTRYFFPFSRAQVGSLTAHTNHKTSMASHSWLYRETRLLETSFDELAHLGQPSDVKQYTEDFCAQHLPEKYRLTERVDLNSL